MANWIAGAIKHPGALTKKAKKAGTSPMSFARAHQSDSGKTGQQARLAMTLQGFKSHMPAGASLSPKGNLGDNRVAESDTQRGFKNRGGKLSGAAAFGSGIGTIGSMGEK